jgi:hypothetical protein
MSLLMGQVHGKKVRTYISVKDACRLFEYGEQYLRRLLRQKTYEKKNRAGLAYRSFLPGTLSIHPMSQKMRTQAKKRAALRGFASSFSGAKNLTPARWGNTFLCVWVSHIAGKGGSFLCLKSCHQLIIGTYRN